MPTRRSTASRTETAARGSRNCRSSRALLSARFPRTSSPPAMAASCRSEEARIPRRRAGGSTKGGHYERADVELEREERQPRSEKAIEPLRDDDAERIPEVLHAQLPAGPSIDKDEAH